MTAAAQPAAARQVRNNHLLVAPGLEVAALIRKTDDRVGVGDIDKARIGAGRIKGDAEGLAQVVGKDGGAVHLSVLALTQHLHPASSAFGHEQVAVGRSDNLARVGQSLGQQVHRKAGWHLGPSAGWALYQMWSVVAGGGGVGRGQVRDRDQTAHARGVGGPIAHSGLACAQLARRLTWLGRAQDASQQHNRTSNHKTT